ncbi:hypothetical protein [Vibrio sp. T11.5]|uniref:hypothetical protein n=1 Tax=Vibrio sp. T11.5 TaxID=2998836 RepID=UPI0022CD6004|nr:hypothetical protein [Vibrio sp. T11.5]MDA0116912.1 hypothetical protein [Vibrio sp. T11.5]
MRLQSEPANGLGNNVRKTLVEVRRQYRSSQSQVQQTRRPRPTRRSFIALSLRDDSNPVSVSRIFIGVETNELYLNDQYTMNFI